MAPGEGRGQSQTVQESSLVLYFAFARRLPLGKEGCA